MKLLELLFLLRRRPDCASLLDGRFSICILCFLLIVIAPICILQFAPGGILFAASLSLPVSGTCSSAPSSQYGEARTNSCRISDGGISTTNRRQFFGQGLSTILASYPAMGANAAETIGKDPDCNEARCLGVWDGLLADCPHGIRIGAGCASSQDDTPGVFAEPWDFSDSDNLDWETQMNLLKSGIQLASSKRGDRVQTTLESGRYLRVLFTDGKSGEKSIGEFYFTPEDTTIQFRVGAIASDAPALAVTSSTKNLDRCEAIRRQCRLEKLPVLRNRKRTLFFIESDLDTFGPGSAALGPPTEMSSGDIEGRDFDDDPEKKRVDVLQGFPLR